MEDKGQRPKANDIGRLPETGFIRMRGVCAPHGVVPASRATIHAWIRAGLFPAPVPLGPGRMKGFRVEDVRAFLSQPNALRPVPHADATPSPEHS